MSDEQSKTKLDTLKEKATQMGISFHPNIGEEKLEAKITLAEKEAEQHEDISAADQLASGVDLPPEATPTDPPSNPVPTPPVEPTQTLQPLPPTQPDVPEGMGNPVLDQKIPEPSKKKSRAEIFAKRKREAAKLVRIRVTCMDPTKKDWPGEIISAGSSKLGTFKKYVPFNGTPYHVPNIIYQTLKDRTCSIFYEVKHPNGQKTKKTKQVPAFNIELLPPLTMKELEDLAKQQAMAGSVEQ